MIDKKEIIKLVSKLTHRGGVQTGRGIYPEREWFFGIALTAAVFLSAAYYAGSVFFYEYRNIDVAIEADVRNTVYEKEIVDGVIDQYAARAELFESLRNEGGGVPAQSEQVGEADDPVVVDTSSLEFE